MIARILRTLTPTGWLWLGIGVALLAIGAALYLHGRRAADDDRADRDQAVITRAADGRETAAGERAADTRTNTERLNERNRDAERTPDRLPDDAELHRGCRQLREAGTTGVPACRGFEG